MKTGLQYLPLLGGVLSTKIPEDVVEEHICAPLQDISVTKYMTPS